MRIKCITSKLNNIISKVEKITGKNLNLPILNCILLEAKEKKLIIKSTNLDLGVEISINTEVESEGVVAVPGSILKNLLNNISDKNISLSLENDNLTLLSDTNKSVIKSYSNEDFPLIPKVDSKNKIIIDCKKLLKGFKSVWYSASTSTIRPELSSVFISTRDNYLYFVATDSFRLAEIKIPITSNQEIKSILIPYKNIPEIIRVFEDIDGDVEINFTKNQIAFKYDNIYLTSRIIDGNFPDYQQLIPKEFTTEVVVLLDDLINTLKIINIFSNKFNQVNFNINPKNKLFEMQSKSDEVGENTNKISAALTGDSLSINFNYRYIIDSFQSILTDSIVLQFNGLNKPLVIRGVSDNQFLYLVMPMNK
jgi:DNA polymerase III subunit beta